MNEVLQQLHDRKSVRVYEDRAIDPEVKQAILEAAIQAPSAGNMALYTILDITDQTIKDKLAVSCDILSRSIQDALDLILKPDRLRATLRT